MGLNRGAAAAGEAVQAGHSSGSEKRRPTHPDLHLIALGYRDMRWPGPLTGRCQHDRTSSRPAIVTETYRVRPALSDLITSYERLDHISVNFKNAQYIHNEIKKHII